MDGSELKRHLRALCQDLLDNRDKPIELAGRLAEIITHLPDCASVVCPLEIDPCPACHE